MKILLFLICLSTGFASIPSKLNICASCHGLDGQAIDKNWPNLNAQSANYIINQVLAYQKGKRASTIMQVYANMLDENELKAIANYYAEQAPTLIPNTEKPSPGALLFKYGLAQKRVPSCSACHGPDGQGNASSFPRIAGQNQAYLYQQLKDFQNNKRQNDGQGMMRDICQRLSDDELHALALYLGQE